MDNNFNPDAYLAQKSTASSGFNPDAYLAAKSAAPAAMSPQDQEREVSNKAIGGMLPYDQEKSIWDQANKDGLDYYEAKKRVVEARNKYANAPENRSSGIVHDIGAANELVGSTVMAPMREAAKGIEATGQAIQDKYPGVAGSLLGGALKFGSGAIPQSPLGLGASVAADTAGPALLEKSKEPAKKIVGFFAQKFGGVSSDTLKLLEDRAPEVVAYARQGYEAATKAATDAGKAVQSHIEDFANKAGEEYRRQLETIISKNPQYNNLRIDLQRMSGDALQKIRDDFGFADSSGRISNLNILDPVSGKPIQAAQGAIKRLGKSASDVATFNEFADQFKNQLTPTQAYYLQRDLSGAIKSAGDSELGAALSQMKKLVVNGYDATVANTPMANLNKNYRSAMSMVEDLSKVSNSDNPLSTIKSAFARYTNTADTLKDFFKKSPAAAKAWSDAEVAEAGRQISAWSRGLPNNGLALAPGLVGAGLGHIASSNPVAAVAAGVGAAAGTSPRLYGEAFNALSKTAPQAVKRGLSNASLAALRKMREQDNQP